MLDSLPHWFQGLLSSPTSFQQHLIATILVIGGFTLLRFLLLRILYRRVHDSRTIYQWQKTITYTVVILGFFVVGRIWSESFQSVSTFLGLVSAGMAIALKDPIVNLAGWLFILWRHPFKVGDRIQIGEHKGDVIDIRIFQFSLNEIGNWVAADQSTGRVIHIPNGKIFTEAQANYGQSFQYLWNELPVLITFESDWKKAKQILVEIANKGSLALSKEAEEGVKRAARRYMIFYTHLTPIVYTEVADSGICLTIRYLCEARKRRSSAEDIWENILERFSAERDIDFAYPTVRYFDNREEGKAGVQSAPSRGEA